MRNYLFMKTGLLVLLVVKCNTFLLEAGILHVYSLVTRWLVFGYSLMLCCSCSMQLFMRYLIKENTGIFCLKDPISCCICEVYVKCSKVYSSIQSHA